MDDNQQNDSKLKEGAKTAANLAAKKASSAILKYVGVALLPILPYIIGVILIIVVFTVMYFGIAEQANEILTGTEELTERVANAISGYGFRNEEQVEIQEENRFYKQASLYQKLFKLSDYEIILVQQTLLYEANNEDRIYFTDNSDSVDENKDFELDDYDSVIGTITGFIKAYNISYVQGFTNAFMSSSKFKKKNKIMHEPIAAVIKCKLETGEVGGQDRFSNCYKGYLNADYDVIIDALVRFGYLSYNIKKDYLTLDNSWIYDLLFGPSEIPALFEELVKKFNSLIDTLSRQVSKYIPTFGVWNAFYQSWSDHNASLRKIANILIRGTLAEGTSDEHYFYEGYIASHLKEFYKSEYDEGIDYVKLYFDGEITKEELVKKAEKEIALKEMISQDIIDYVNTYYTLEYGDAYFISLNNRFKLDLITNEKNISVTVKIDGKDVNVSFQDYVSLILLNKHGPSIFDAPPAVLEAAIIQARTEAYLNADQNGSLLDYVANGDFSNAYDIFSKLNPSQLSALQSAFSNTSGKVIKDKDGNLDGDFKLDIDNVDDKATADDIINSQGGKVENKNNVGSPFPTIDNIRDYLSAIYGYDPTDTVHAQGHGGVDIALGLGTSVYSASGGTVVAAYNSCPYGSLGSSCGPDGYHGYGNIVVVQSVDSKGVTYYTYYAHMGSGTVGVNVGDKVETGQYLGQIGSSGDSSGPHLHFEVRYGSNNKESQFDPLKFYGL